MRDARRRAGPPPGARLAENIREKLTTLLMRGELRDPALEGATVTSVRLAKGSKSGIATVRCFPPDAKREKSIIKAFESAWPRARHALLKSLHIRSVPELKFVWDGGRDHAFRVEELLAEIASENHAANRNDGGEQ